MRSTLLAFAATAIASGCRVPPPATADVETLLKDHTQALLDAVTHGDPSVWERLLDPRIVFVSESGETETKASLLAQIAPLPPGISGSLEVTHFAVQRFGETAVVFHVDRERERYFGQALSASYVSTATWRLSEGQWRLIAMQTHASLDDPPSIREAAEALEAYVGTYQLAQNVTYTITRKGDRLEGQRTGRSPQPLLVEVHDVLFVPGQPRARKVFFRSAAGRITRFVDRREGHDVVWTRLE